MKKLVLITAILITANLLFAQIINIPADYPTIQEGIDASNEGDTVLVQSGTYVENISIVDKNITLASLMLTTLDTSYISQTIIDGNGSGNVVYLRNVDTTTFVYGFTITNGKAGYGGGIHCKLATPKLIWLDVNANVAVYAPGRVGGGYGGGIYCNNGIKLQNSKIRNNIITFTGGGITGVGGGIFIDNYESSFTEDFYCEDVEISNNHSAAGGGIGFTGGYLGSFGSTIHMSNVVITNNKADWSGGGVCLDECYMWGSIWKNVSIKNNTAVFGIGGGISIVDGDIITPQIFTTVHIDSNYAAQSGGGIFIGEYSFLEIEPYSGPFFNSSVADISINGNNCEMDGGGIFCEGYIKIIGDDSLNSIIRINGNVSQGNGGGIYNKNSDWMDGFTLHSISIQNNQSALCGGGIYVNYKNNDLVNLVITGNTADSLGGGIFRYRGKGNVINSTFSDNYAHYGGGAIYSKQDQNPELELLNCILWNDQPDEIFDEYNSFSLLADFSNIQGGFIGPGNIDEDPLFVMSDDHLFQISDNSPCIDAGKLDTTGLNLPEFDLAGNPRFVNTRVDMGAYEWNMFVGVDEPVFNETETPKVSIYPNPVISTAKLSGEFVSGGPVNVCIYNTSGTCLKGWEFVTHQTNQQEFTLNLSDLRPGLYFLRLQAGNEVVTKKVLKL